MIQDIEFEFAGIANKKLEDVAWGLHCSDTKTRNYQSSPVL